MIAPGSRLKKLFGWTAEGRKAERVRPEAVPPDLQALISLAEKWGVTCDVTRHDVASKASEAQLAEFSAALAPYRSAIIDWLYSFEDDTGPHEASVFQAMLILELEECGGPGIPAYFDWAYQKHFANPTPITLRRLRHAYDFATRCDILRHQPPEVVKATRAALGIPKSGV